LKKFSTLCFDLFNTLVSVADVPERVGRFTADVLGIDQEAWNRACFSSAHEITQPTDHAQIIKTLAHSIDSHISNDLISTATEHRQRRFDYALKHVRKDILDDLLNLKHSGMILCLISNASSGEVIAWPDSPLAELFDHAVFSCDCGFKKPELDIYSHAMKCCDTESSKVAFIGDGGSNELVGASSAGLTTILTRQFSKKHRLAAVRQGQGHAIDIEIGNLGELQSALNMQVKNKTGL